MKDEKKLEVILQIVMGQEFLVRQQTPKGYLPDGRDQKQLDMLKRIKKVIQKKVVDSLEPIN